MTTESGVAPTEEALTSLHPDSFKIVVKSPNGDELLYKNRLSGKPWQFLPGGAGSWPHLQQAGQYSIQMTYTEQRPELRAALDKELLTVTSSGVVVASPGLATSLVISHIQLQGQPEHLPYRRDPDRAKSPELLVTNGTWRPCTFASSLRELSPFPNTGREDDERSLACHVRLIAHDAHGNEVSVPKKILEPRLEPQLARFVFAC